VVHQQILQHEWKDTYKFLREKKDLQVHIWNIRYYVFTSKVIEHNVMGFVHKNRCLACPKINLRKLWFMLFDSHIAHDL
jgi:hypothetical protein